MEIASNLKYTWLQFKIEAISNYEKVASNKTEAATNRGEMKQFVADM